MTVGRVVSSAASAANILSAQVAMVEWVENDRAVDVLVATKYANDTEGIAFTRKLCPVSSRFR